MAILFYVGLHHPADAKYVPRACISINTLFRRRKPIQVGANGKGGVLLDSGAFTEISRHGRYRRGVAEYAAAIERLAGLTKLDAAVAEDWMCERFILDRTGLTLREHQALTIERYDLLMGHRPNIPIMPVLQGYKPEDYARHVHDYGDRLKAGAWVGVGSVCKRNGRPAVISRVLQAIHAVRPDLRLHGFGVKKTALRHPAVRALLHSADSMAWSSAARWEGRDANDWREAERSLTICKPTPPILVAMVRLQPS